MKSLTSLAVVFGLIFANPPALAVPSAFAFDTLQTRWYDDFNRDSLGVTEPGNTGAGVEPDESWVHNPDNFVVYWIQFNPETKASIEDGVLRYEVAGENGWLGFGMTGDYKDRDYDSFSLKIKGEKGGEESKLYFNLNGVFDFKWDNARDPDGKPLPPITTEWQTFVISMENSGMGATKAQRNIMAGGWTDFHINSAGGAMVVYIDDIKQIQTREYREPVAPATPAATETAVATELPVATEPPAPFFSSSVSLPGSLRVESLRGDADWTETVAELTVEENTAYEIKGNVQKGAMTLGVDGNALRFNPGETTTEVGITAGTHTITVGGEGALGVVEMTRLGEWDNDAMGRSESALPDRFLFESNTDEWVWENPPVPLSLAEDAFYSVTANVKTGAFTLKIGAVQLRFTEGASTTDISLPAGKYDILAGSENAVGSFEMRNVTAEREAMGIFPETDRPMDNSFLVDDFNRASLLLDPEMEVAPGGEFGKPNTDGSPIYWIQFNDEASPVIENGALKLTAKAGGWYGTASDMAFTDEYNCVAFRIRGEKGGEERHLTFNPDTQGSKPFSELKDPDGNPITITTEWKTVIVDLAKSGWKTLKDGKETYQNIHLNTTGAMTVYIDEIYFTAVNLEIVDNSAAAKDDGSQGAVVSATEAVLATPTPAPVRTEAPPTPAPTIAASATPEVEAVKKSTNNVPIAVGLAVVLVGAVTGIIVLLTRKPKQ